MSNYDRYDKLKASLVGRNKYRNTRFRINNQIRAQKVRLIDNKGEQIGVVNIKKARNIADEKNLDLVEVAPGAKPPVVKVLDYNKFLYEQEKKQSKEKKKAKGGEQKEIQLSPFIGEADLKYRLKKAKEFAKDNNSLRIVIRFKGRQITQKKFGYELLDRVKEELSKFYQQSGKTKEQGKRLIMRMDPI